MSSGPTTDGSGGAAQRPGESPRAGSALGSRIAGAVAALQPHADFGRVPAAYCGVFIIGSLLR